MKLIVIYTAFNIYLRYIDKYSMPTGGASGGGEYGRAGAKSHPRQPHSAHSRQVRRARKMCSLPCLA